MKSILKDVVYLNIVTSGLNPNTSEIIEIAAIKIVGDKILKFNTLIKPFEEIPASIFGHCKNLKEEDLNKAPTIYQLKNKFIEFIEDYPIICHDLNSKKSFLDKYIFNDKKAKNQFLDSMQLGVILEPYHSDYSLSYLIQNITNLKKDVKNRALNDVLLNIYVVDALLLRLWKEEENRLDKLYFNLDSISKTLDFQNGNGQSI